MPGSHRVRGVPISFSRHKTMWERACSRWRLVSRHHDCLIHRYREQARSYRGSAMHTCFVLGKNPDVGVSLLAMASGQSTSSLPDPPPSRASPAPTGFVASRKFQSTQNNVGAGLLAMASGQPTSSLPDPPPSRAGSLPQGIGDAHIFCARQKPQCRSEPARDGVWSADIIIA